MATNTTTLGNRFVANIKARYTKTKSIRIPDTQVLRDKRKRAAASVIRKLLGLPRSSPVEYLDYSQFTLNGARLTFGYDLSLFDDALEGDRTHADLDKQIIDADALKEQQCKELELLNTCLGAPVINKFKTFARARFDKTDRVLALSAADFETLVAEFLHTQREHTCPL